MNFFRMIKMDFKRMFLSGKFYFAIAGAMLVTVLNISQEAMQSRWNASVYYLVVMVWGHFLKCFLCWLCCRLR